MAEIYRDDTTKSLAFGVTGATVSAVSFERYGEVVATTGSTPAAVPYSITHLDGPFDVVWTYTVAAIPYTRRETHSIVTPLFKRADLEAYDPDFTALTDAQIVKMERYVRQIIEKYCSQTFGYREGAIDVYGNGTNVLKSPQRVNSIDYLVPYGYTQQQQIDGYAYNVRPVNDGFDIVSVGPSEYSVKADDTIYYESVIGSHLTLSTYKFPMNGRFTLKGSFGYYSVPQEVQDAAFKLAEQFNCNESLWRERYVRSMRSADWRVDFMEQTYISTGNVIADQLLAEYVRNDMVVL